MKKKKIDFGTTKQMGETIMVMKCMIALHFSTCPLASSYIAFDFEPEICYF